MSLTPEVKAYLSKIGKKGGKKGGKAAKEREKKILGENKFKLLQSLRGEMGGRPEKPLDEGSKLQAYNRLKKRESRARLKAKKKK